MKRLDKYFTFLRAHPECFSNASALFHGIQLIKNKNAIKKFESSKLHNFNPSNDNKKPAEIGVLISDPWFTVVRDLVRFPDGSIGTYDRFFYTKGLEGGHNVVVLPLHKARIILIRHFRHATRQWHWEVPRGFGEPMVAAEEMAREELREELGVEAEKITHLGMAHQDTGAFYGQAEYYLAEVSEPPKELPESAKNEGISEFRLVTPQEFSQMILGGEMTDYFSIVAYTFAKERGLL